MGMFSLVEPTIPTQQSGGLFVPGNPENKTGVRNVIVVPAVVIVAGKLAIAAGKIVSYNAARTSGIVVYAI